MYVDLKTEDRQWVADQILRYVPEATRDDPTFVAAVARYVETGELQGFLFERFGKAFDHLQKLALHGNPRSRQERDADLYAHSYRLLELMGGERWDDFQREFRAAYPDSSQVSQAERDAFAYDYNQRTYRDVLDKPETQTLMKRMGAYTQQHGWPPLDNPRGMRTYMDGYIRFVYPNASDAKVQELIEMNMDMFNSSLEQDRREARRQRWGFVGLFALIWGTIPLVLLLGFAGMLVVGVLYTSGSPVARVINLSIFALMAGLSAFFVVRRSLDTPGERVRLYLSGVLLVATFGALWWVGLLDTQVSRTALLNYPDFTLTLLLGAIGVVTNAAVWIRERWLRVLSWLLVLGVAAVLGWLLLPSLVS